MCCGANKNKVAGGTIKWRVTVPGEPTKTADFDTRADARAYAVSLGVPTQTKAVTEREKV